MVPSPARGSLRRRKASYVPQMSEPPAATLQLGSMTYWDPAWGVGKPMSWHVQPVGHRLGGGAAEPVSETESRVSVARVVLSPELTASPASMGPAPPNVTLEPTRAVQATPLVEVKAVNVLT